MKASIFLPLLIATGMAAISCNRKDETSAGPKVNTAGSDIPILKIEPGDFWNYRVHVEIPAGVTGEGASAVDTIHERVRTYLGKVPFINGQPDVDCFEVIAPNSPPDREFVNILEDRVELRGELKMKDSDSRPIVFPKPIVFVRAGLRGGDALELPTVTDAASGAVAPRTCIIIGREECVVPAGTFPSIHMEMRGADGKIESRRELWFSPGVGIVKETRTRYATGKVIVKETHELATKGHRALAERPQGDAPR